MPDGAPPGAPSGGGRRILTVSELTREIKGALEGAFGAVWLTGEVSNLRRAPSGHVYLTLKDAGAQLRAVVWGSTARYLRHLPADGDQVLCRGRVTVYEARGDYQVIVDYLEPAGVGDLYRRFEEVKARLGAEGLFDPDRKRPLPALVRRVAVVTSPTGAAVRDILNVLGRRAPGMAVLVVPALVQGRDAPRQVIAALEAAAGHGGLDAVVVARGGGSLEDLAAFNDEALARAIAACPVPVVAGVGHETDVTIADLVADLRAPTPSAAAELISTPWVEWRAHVERMRDRLALAARARLAERRLAVERARGRLVDPAEHLRRLIQRVDDLHATLGRLAFRRLGSARHGAEYARVRLLAASPGARLPHLAHRSDMLAARAERAMGVGLERAGARLAGASGRLEGLSPMNVLARGFAVARKDGQVLRDAARVRVGDRIQVRLHRGELDCRVEGRPDGRTDGKGRRAGP
jgi:exodeoxyribonuclease VII large subunit